MTSTDGLFDMREAMLINSGRITDPATLSPEKIAQVCAQRGHLVVQFSRSEAYTPAILTALNEACRLSAQRLQVRFYGHYGERFDAALLRHLPEVQNLAVDCLTEMDHEEEVGRLPNLKQLTFGVFELNRPDLLDTLNLDQLETLTLIENRKRNVDLSPLSRATSLKQLFINGHSKGVHAIAGLPSLRKLLLGAYAKAHPLCFVSDLPALEQMTLILGGRPDINDLSSHTLKMLQVLRVRGLATLGNLSRFPALTALRVEDQIQLLQLDLRDAQLERLALFNCKKLAELPGLEMQQRLREFAASRVALDLDALRDWQWPAITQAVDLYSGNRAWNDEARQRLDAKGLNGKRELWP